MKNSTKAVIAAGLPAPLRAVPGSAVARSHGDASDLIGAIAGTNVSDT